MDALAKYALFTDARIFSKKLVFGHTLKALPGWPWPAM